MEKKELIRFLDEIFKPLGYSRKGISWSIETEELEKVIQIQQSKFGDVYYINFGFIIKRINIEKLEMHVFDGFGSVDDNENHRMRNLLDMETDIPEEQRKVELKNLINTYIIFDLDRTNTENDLKNKLMKRPHLNNIPLVVKKALNLM